MFSGAKSCFGRRFRTSSETVAHACTSVPCLSREESTDVVITDSYSARIDGKNTIRIHYNDLVVAKERIKIVLRKLERLDPDKRTLAKNRSGDVRVIVDKVLRRSLEDDDQDEVDYRLLSVITGTNPESVRRRSTESEEDDQLKNDVEENTWRLIPFRKKVKGLAGNPIYLPVMTGNMDVPNENIVITQEDFRRNKVTHTTSTTVNTNAGITVGASGTRFSGSRSLARGESYNYEFYEDECDELTKKGYTCKLGKEEEKKVGCDVDPSIKNREAIKLLNKIMDKKFLLKNANVVIVGAADHSHRSINGLDILGDKDNVDIDIFEWQYDNRTEQPAVLHLRAKYYSVPFWIVNRYEGDRRIVKSQLYKATQADGTHLSNMSYNVHTTHPDIWNMCRRANTSNLEFTDPQLEALVIRQNNWYSSVLSANELQYAKQHMKDDTTTLVTAPLPLSLTIAAARDKDLVNWEASINDNVETSTLRGDHMGHVYGRFAKLTYLLDGEPSINSSVFCMYNITGGMNNQLFVWV